MRLFAFILACFSGNLFAQETYELLGQLGGRAALLNLGATPREDGSARLTGDCAEFCGSEAHLEPVLVDRRGGCTLLRPQARR